MTGSFLVFVSGQKEAPLTEDFIRSLHADFANTSLNWLHPDKAAEIKCDTDISPEFLKAIRESASRN